VLVESAAFRKIIHAPAAVEKGIAMDRAAGVFVEEAEHGGFAGSEFDALPGAEGTQFLGENG
jgi:hypothetical protein